jgi:hypothetical protein
MLYYSLCCEINCHEVVIKDYHDLFLFTQLTIPTLVILDQLYDYF